MQNGMFAEHQTFPSSPELRKAMHPAKIYIYAFCNFFGEGREVRPNIPDWLKPGGNGQSPMLGRVAEAWVHVHGFPVMSLACG